MKNPHLGTIIMGNFSTKSPLPSIDGITIYRNNDSLFAKTRDSIDIELFPADENAKVVVQEFSTRIGEENESIYEVKKTSTYIVLLLYSFLETVRIELPMETMFFYPDRTLENDAEQLKAMNINNLSEFLVNEFIYNRSIFVVGKKINENNFRICGTMWLADCEREKAGLFRIRKFQRKSHNNNSENISQIFGFIRFISSMDAETVNSKGFRKMEIQTNSIFKAWNEYMDFEEKVYVEEVRSRGFLKYSGFDDRSEDLVLCFPAQNNLSETPLFANPDGAEFEIVVYKKDDPDKDSSGNIEKILEHKAQDRNNVIFLGPCLNEGYLSNEAHFRVPEERISIPSQGIVILSDRSIHNEVSRRKRLMRKIEEKNNYTSNMLMKLTAGEPDSHLGERWSPVTDEVLFKMFRRKVKISENYREAMSIAINTPDIALIQGPPGTGKTTLINGIVARLSSLGKKNYKVLISSEQHEVLGNVVSKLSGSKSIPPFVTSRKYYVNDEEEEERNLGANTEKFQQDFINLCKDILREKKSRDGISDQIKKIAYLSRDIMDHGYDLNHIQNRMPEIKECLAKLNLLGTASEKIIQLNALIESRNQEASLDDLDPLTRKILGKIEAQRMDPTVFFEDDGRFQMNELQRLLGKCGEEIPLLDPKILDTLNQGPNESSFQVFPQYKDYVDKIKVHFKPETEFVIPPSPNAIREVLDGIFTLVSDFTKTREKDFFDILDEFSYRLNDVDNVSDIVKKYTNIIGSTCAQAEKSTRIFERQSSTPYYDYVIIDEAARANPLDIMIPILLGSKVILVGDQMQLPHYIETKYVKLFEEHRQDLSIDQATILKKSLFEVIYQSIEESYNLKKLAFKRHIRLQEQHRMNPLIGDFISREFYEDPAKNGTDKIMNGPQTINNVNDYHLFNGKNVVWIDVPITEGKEEQKISYFRDCEVKKIVEILNRFIRQNPKRTLDIGIISFYKEQVKRISTAIKENFDEESREKIKCDTVDSVQGQEFDVVILSTVRSNFHVRPGDSLGFIHYSKSRINVAFSRGKKILIVVGDKETFTRNDTFRRYWEYVVKEGYYE